MLTRSAQERRQRLQQKQAIEYEVDLFMTSYHCYTDDPKKYIKRIFKNWDLVIGIKAIGCSRKAEDNEPDVEVTV